MANTQQDMPLDTGQYRNSWRLTFRFDGERVELIRRQQLKKLAPASPGTRPTAGKNSGSWIELRDGHDRFLFHRLLRDPFGTVAEVHSPDGTIRVVERRPEPGEFEVVVPDIPEAVGVVLVSSPPSAARAAEPAHEVARFTLRD